MLRALLLWMLAVLSVCAIAAAGVFTAVPSPPGSQLVYFAKLVILCLVGPATFAWAWGPQPMSMLARGVAIAVPVLSMAVLMRALQRPRKTLLLAISAVLWGSLGGYSAYLATTGTI